MPAAGACPVKSGTSERHDVTHSGARTLWGEKATFDSLSERFARGDVVKRSRLTPEFTYKDFQRYYGDEALNVALPPKVVCKIIETEPVVKGQTAANSFKPAVLDNGLRIMVPPFVAQDEDIVVHTETFEYSERA